MLPLLGPSWSQLAGGHVEGQATLRSQPTATDPRGPAGLSSSLRFFYSLGTYSSLFSSSSLHHAAPVGALMESACRGHVEVQATSCSQPTSTDPRGPAGLRSSCRVSCSSGTYSSLFLSSSLHHAVPVVASMDSGQLAGGHAEESACRGPCGGAGNLLFPADFHRP